MERNLLAMSELRISSMVAGDRVMIYHGDLFRPFSLNLSMLGDWRRLLMVESL